MNCLVPFLLDPIKCLNIKCLKLTCYVSHKVSHVTQFCYIFIRPLSSSLTTNSLRMSASAHETLVPQKSIMSVSAHKTRVQSELQPYFISSQLGLVYLPACLPLGAAPFFSGAATFLGSSFGRRHIARYLL